MKKRNHKWMVTILLTGILLALCACGNTGKGKEQQITESGQEATGLQNITYENMQWETGEELAYAHCFQIEKSGVYKRITVSECGQFLLVPKDSPVPENVPGDVVVLHTPLERVYLAASSAFDLIREIGEMDRIAFSGIKEKDLYIAEATEAMQNGKMTYAGKYSAPDYELLLAGECSLAIESTMINHSPAAREKLESLGIPVLIERSSYETHPLGRLEWVKFYGALLGREEEAKRFYDGELAKVEPVMQREKTGCMVAFFNINTNGAINVRKTGDYVPKMISLAGGEYVPSYIEGQEDNALSTMNMLMEDFYLAARDADILIYNGSISGALEYKEELIAMNALFADFKAVREDRVYCTGKNVFQETTAIGSLMEDMGTIMRDPECTQLKQLTKLK